MPFPYALADAEAFVERSRRFDLSRDVDFTLELPGEGLIGGLGFHARGGLGPEVGYWLGRPYWGLGLASEALAAAMAWAQGEWDQRCVVAHHFVDNNPNFMSDGGVGQLAIVNGVLHIASNTAVSMGTWYVNTCTQKWRNEKAGFRLIGLTSGEMHRGCGCGRASDTNYLTGDQILTDDRGSDMTRAKRPVKTRKKNAPRTILWEDFNFDSYCSAAEE